MSEVRQRQKPNNNKSTTKAGSNNSSNKKSSSSSQNARGISILDIIRVLATLVQLLERSLIRVGNEEYARQNDSFGLTTMRDKHVRVSGGTVRFQFRSASPETVNLGWILNVIGPEADARSATDTAVVAAVGRTGRLITSGALILFLAFVSLSRIPETDVKVLATGLALGILIDATVVRGVLAPALVAGLGRANWWAPRWLGRRSAP